MRKREGKLWRLDNVKQQKRQRKQRVRKAAGQTWKEKGSMGKKQRRAERKVGVFERALCSAWFVESWMTPCRGSLFEGASPLTHRHKWKQISDKQTERLKHIHTSACISFFCAIWSETHTNHTPTPNPISNTIPSSLTDRMFFFFPPLMHSFLLSPASPFTFLPSLSLLT